jgi:hypothetical protein
VRVLVDLDAQPLRNPRLEELVEGAPPAAAGIGLTSHHTTVSPRVYQALWRRSEITAATLLDTAAPQDRGYAVISALALAVEAVEALCTFLSDCDPGLTAAVRPFERAAL